MLLLARWYGLAETALLEACQDRLSFRKFLGLPLEDDGADDVAWPRSTGARSRRRRWRRRT